MKVGLKALGPPPHPAEGRSVKPLGHPTGQKREQYYFTTTLRTEKRRARAKDRFKFQSKVGLPVDIDVVLKKRGIFCQQMKNNKENQSNQLRKNLLC